MDIALTIGNRNTDPAVLIHRDHIITDLKRTPLTSALLQFCGREGHYCYLLGCGEFTLLILRGLPSGNASFASALGRRLEAQFKVP